MTLNENTITPKIKFVIGIIILAIVVRVLQFLPPNVAPIGAMALFGGTY